ncbi:hypothetical protein WMF04_28725 [Sorangium sp. So ce260]|uniref:hypothetical protein n=1 Tax=Sorangium sp. So ce260 TaxID=3133291 RepID=UPI003F6327B0
MRTITWASQELGEAKAGEAAAYVQDITDRIDFTSLGANFVGRNQGDEAHAGAELSLRLAHERSRRT